MCLTTNIFLEVKSTLRVKMVIVIKINNRKLVYISNDLTAKHLYVHPYLQHERSEKYGANERIFSLKIKVFILFKINIVKQV